MKKSKKKPNMNNESQFINITTLCDGYGEMDPEKIESFKEHYFYIIKDDRILFPFIFKETYITEGYPEKTIINIRKNEYILEKDGKKTLYSV
jgi:hypothetical protein